MKSPSQPQPEPILTQTSANRLIRFLLIAALILLPFSHFRWLPNLGTTRPISSVLFVLILGLIILNAIVQYISHNDLRLKGPLNFELLRNHLLTSNGAYILLPWIILILLGIVSAAFTPFYGNFLQALNRLLGYVVIFATLYCGLYACKIFSMQQIATYISLGYLPVLGYGIIEAIATRGIFWAYQIVQYIHSWLIVDFPWAWRTSYFATEPSFVGFQLLLLITLLPYLQNQVLRITNILIIVIAVIFSSSGTLLFMLATYLAFFIFFKLNFRFRVWLVIISMLITSIAGIWYAFFSPFQIDFSTIENLSVSLNVPRLNQLFMSSAIRNTYSLNLVYALIDTRGLGLGIGQYGHFWKEIFLRHFDLQVVDPTGEISRTLASPDYGRPWSVILGIGVDLGIIGLLILLYFIYKCWRSIRGPHSRAIFVASMIALFGAYPIVTPHIWLALALLIGLPDPEPKELSAA